MTKLEEAICSKFDVKYGVFTGNGTTAMYLAFLAIGRQDKKVVFPAISCTNPVNSAIFAGYQVDYCDVNLNDYTIDETELKVMLQTGEYGIVVPTHIYGHRYNEYRIRALCKKYDVVLFEDAAQSYYVGDMDISVMSFGHTKMCETDLGGGIALTNNHELYERLRWEKEKIAGRNIAQQKAFDEYRVKYYGIVYHSESWEGRNDELKKLQLDSEKYFICDLNDNDDIFDKLSKSSEIVSLRCDKTEIYEQNLDDRYVVKPLVKDKYRWRYTFLYKGDRDYLLDNARKRGIDISSWYFSLAGIYKKQHLKNADIVESQIVNLWVDELHSVEQIKDEIDILNSIMEEDYARDKQRTMDKVTSK